MWLNGFLLVLAFVLDFGPASRMMLITASFISLIVELVNTAIEADQHELAKGAKDSGSAVQTLALMLLALVWLMALWREYGLNLF